jgi:hypothetical protein
MEKRIRCEKKTCKGRINTVGNLVARKQTSHTHVLDVNKIKFSKVVNNIKTIAVNNCDTGETMLLLLRHHYQF